MNWISGLAIPGRSKLLVTISSKKSHGGFVQEDTLASRGQKMIYHGPLKPLRKYCSKAHWYHGLTLPVIFITMYIWYPFIGRKRVLSALNTKWGKAVSVIWRWSDSHARDGAEDSLTSLRWPDSYDSVIDCIHRLTIQAEECYALSFTATHILQR